MRADHAADRGDRRTNGRRRAGNRPSRWPPSFVEVEADRRALLVLMALRGISPIKLLEVGLYLETDAVWVVTADRDTQIERLMESRELTRPEAETRVDAQPPQAPGDSRQALRPAPPLAKDHVVEPVPALEDVGDVGLQDAGQAGAAEVVPQRAQGRRRHHGVADPTG